MRSRLHFTGETNHRWKYTSEFSGTEDDESYEGATAEKVWIAGYGGCRVRMNGSPDGFFITTGCWFFPRYIKRKGNRIRITFGPLKDMEEKIKRVDKRGMSGQVILSFYGKDIPVWLGFD